MGPSPRVPLPLDDETVAATRVRSAGIQNLRGTRLTMASLGRLPQIPTLGEIAWPEWSMMMQSLLTIQDLSEAVVPES